MKTVEEILGDYDFGDGNNENVAKVMKLYANQKLDEAAINLKQTAGQWNADYNNERNKILSLKDEV